MAPRTSKATSFNNVEARLRLFLHWKSRGRLVRHGFADDDRAGGDAKFLENFGSLHFGQRDLNALTFCRHLPGRLLIGFALLIFFLPGLPAKSRRSKVAYDVLP